MMLDLILFVGGGVGVWLGAEGMVRGAVKLAEFLGISPLVVGLTVVAFGTSAPELVVSVVAIVQGHSDISLGNVIGSNIINVGLVLGLSAVTAPVFIATNVLRRDIPMVLVATLAVVAMVWIGDEVSRVDGALLLLGFVVHTIYCFKLGAKEKSQESFPSDQRPTFGVLHIAFLIGGTAVLALGAEGMVQGAVGIAETVGISQRTIGMTIVAFGTSVPELAASVVAARHGESDLAVGNVVGSNLYNILLILGTVSLISPIPCNFHDTFIDFFFFTITVVVLVPMIRIGWRLSRVDGLILLALFGISTVTLLVY